MNHLFTGGGKYRALAVCFFAAAMVLSACSAFGNKDAIDDLGSLVIASKPWASVGSGVVPYKTTIELGTSTSDATIYYTTDGSTPSITSPAYSPENQLVLRGPVTIQAIAVKEGLADSELLVQAYAIDETTYPKVDNAFTDLEMYSATSSTSTAKSSGYTLVKYSSDSAKTNHAGNPFSGNENTHGANHGDDDIRIQYKKQNGIFIRAAITEIAVYDGPPGSVPPGTGWVAAGTTTINQDGSSYYGDAKYKDLHLVYKKANVSDTNYITDIVAFCDTEEYYSDKLPGVPASQSIGEGWEWVKGINTDQPNRQDFNRGIPANDFLFVAVKKVPLPD